MIVDAHAHVGPPESRPVPFVEEMVEPLFRWPRRPIPGAVHEPVRPEKLIQDYTEAGVDKVLLFGVAPRPPRVYGRKPESRETLRVGVPNEYVAELTREAPNRLVPVASVSPFQGESAVEELERAVRGLGMKALKLYPTYEHYAPDDRELLWPIYAKAQELDIPVIIHQSWTTVVNAPMKFQRPAQLDEAAREFRDLIIVVAHFGVPWVDEAMCLVGKHDRVFVDLSFWSVLETPEEMMRQLHRAPRFGCGYDRILWGTDYPMISPAQSLQTFREELPQGAERIGVPPLSDEALDLILGGNARTVFQL